MKSQLETRILKRLFPISTERLHVFVNFVRKFIECVACCRTHKFCTSWSCASRRGIGASSTASVRRLSSRSYKPSSSSFKSLSSVSRAVDPHKFCTSSCCASKPGIGASSPGSVRLLSSNSDEIR